MNAQMKIEGGGVGQTTGTFCQWCGKPATGRVEIEPPKRRRETVGGKTIMIIARRAIEADVCDRHRKMVEREIERRRRAQ